MRPPRFDPACLPVVLAALAAAACGDAPPTRPPASPTPAAQRPLPAPRGEPAPSPPRSPARLSLPEKAACAFEATDWSEVPPLRVTTSSSPYGRARAARRARVVFPLEGKGAAMMEVELGAIVVRGAVPRAELPMYAERPTLLGGLLMPNGATELFAESAGPGRLKVALPAIPSELEDTTTPLEAVTACADVKLVPTGFDPWSVLGRGETTEVLLERGAEIALAEGGSRVASTQRTMSTTAVRVLERRHPHARIAWELTPGVVVGWVKESSIERRTIPPRVRMGRARFNPPSTRSRSLSRLRCPFEVPLGVMVEHDPAFIGAIHEGATIDIVAHAQDAEIVEVDGSAFAVAEGAQLFVTKSDLSGCVDPGDP